MWADEGPAGAKRAPEACSYRVYWELKLWWMQVEDKRVVLDDIDWGAVAKAIGTRNHAQCMERWYKCQVCAATNLVAKGSIPCMGPLSPPCRYACRMITKRNLEQVVCTAPDGLLWVR
jgi:hypothetical protein